MRRYTWSAGLLVSIAALAGSLAPSSGLLDDGIGGRGARLAIALAGQAPPATPAVAGVDGPIPQAPDGVPATPFIMAAAVARTTADLIVEQQAMDAAQLGPRPPRIRPEFEHRQRRGVPQ